MGRCYAFVCSRCHFQARVSGGRDRGMHCFTCTIHCLDCQDLFDAVTHIRQKGPRFVMFQKRPGGWRRTGSYPLPLPAHAAFSGIIHDPAAKIQDGILRDGRLSRWTEYQVHCPNNKTHRIRTWMHPGKCPRCGTYLDKTIVPFQTWE